MPHTVRPYAPADETGWLRCRVLSFLGSAYDDVWTRRPQTPVIQLVAVLAEAVIGILDVEVDGDLATIDTLAVHPDHQGRGVASALFEDALDRLPETVTILDAWTRDDEVALRWYHSRGFTESEHYLHVYKSWDDPGEGWSAPVGALVTGFAHARLEDEDVLREQHRRVHVCRRMSRGIRRE